MKPGLPYNHTVYAEFQLQYHISNTIQPVFNNGQHGLSFKCCIINDGKYLSNTESELYLYSLTSKLPILCILSFKTEIKTTRCEYSIRQNRIM